jgi:hypothetical protein
MATAVAVNADALAPERNGIPAATGSHRNRLMETGAQRPVCK